MFFNQLPPDLTRKVVEWAGDPVVKFHWTANSFEFPVDPKALAQHVRKAHGGRDRRCLGFWLEPTADNLVAYAELAWPDRPNGGGRIERMIVAPESRGRGVGQAVVLDLESMFFADGDMHRLELVVASDNPSARTCYERAGFQFEGKLRESRRFGTARRSVDMMSILRHEWEATGE